MKYLRILLSIGLCVVMFLCGSAYFWVYAGDIDEQGLDDYEASQLEPPPPEDNGEAFNQWVSGDDAKCDPEKDVMLNTNIPFIGRCIKKKSTTDSGSTATMGNAFPRLMAGLTRIVMSAVVVVALLAVLIWGFMVAAEGAAGTKEKGLQLIKLAIWWLILVGLSGIILNLINPNFFTT